VEVPVGRPRAAPSAAVAAMLAALLAALAASCGSGSPALQGPSVAGFDPAALIDVLPPDPIRAIRQPRFGSIAEARSRLDDAEAVVALVVEGDARAYPIAILMRHEIVNDQVGGRSVAVSYCPLCNAAVVHDRQIDEMLVATFIASGKLYHSDLVMLDEQTSSLWPQMLGTAVLGDLKGTELTVLPASMVSFADFAEAYPDGRVLEPPGQGSNGNNPYPGYDSRSEPYGDFFPGEPDDRGPAMERVVGVVLEGDARAYPFSSLRARGQPVAVHDTLGGRDIVVFHGGEQRSALDTPAIADGRVVGSSGVFEPRARGRALRFAASGGEIVDEQTGSTWSVLGVATGGPLAGERLTPVPHLDAFWFAWAAFFPRTEVLLAP